jgi:hypothetical protein
MDISSFLQSSNPWDQLEQPERASSSAEAARRILEAAIDLGWHVEEPIYLGPGWNEDGELVFHFILKRPAKGQSRLITARRSQELERFVSQEGWQVEG